MSIARKMMMAATTADTGAWDLDNAAYTATPINYFWVGGQMNSPQSLSFSADGTQMYAVGYTYDYVNQYELSTAWDITTASYLQQYYIGAVTGGAAGQFFKPDGTKMYFVDQSTRYVKEFDLSTAWDISTASYLQQFYVGSQELSPQGLFFSTNGIYMYVIGQSGDDVNQYTLSTAWDISTASYTRVASVAAQETIPRDIFFKSDGTKMYITGYGGTDVSEYNLSTAWDVSTISYVQNFSVLYEDIQPNGLFFKSDGTRMFILGGNLYAVWQYDLSTAWDLSTASFSFPTTDRFSVRSQDLNVYGLCFSADGAHMYVTGDDGNDINQYDLSTAWAIETASYVQKFSVSAQDTSPRGIFFSPDGIYMYVVGDSGNDVNQYTLSTAWDISTAVYTRVRGVSTEDITPRGIYFKSDGTSMYVVGQQYGSVYQYNLSTAWNISTASYVQNFSISTQETAPNGLFFKPDGTRMFIVGSTNDTAYQYDLATAWDISTASYVNKSVGMLVPTLERYPTSVCFKSNGTKMYVMGLGTNAIWAFDVSI